MSLELETTESLYPFVLTEEQEQLRREIRDFAAREIAPNVMKWDEASEFPLDVVKKLGQMGLLGVIFPPELNGSGLGYVDYVLAIEELAAVDVEVQAFERDHVAVGLAQADGADGWRVHWGAMLTAPPGATRHPSPGPAGGPARPRPRAAVLTTWSATRPPTAW